VKFGGEVLFASSVGGGATGHKAFARDLGVLVKLAELNQVIVALVRIWPTATAAIAKGAVGSIWVCRWPPEKISRREAENFFEANCNAFRRIEMDDRAPTPPAACRCFRAEAKGLNYLGVAMPVGQINTPQLMLRVAEIAGPFTVPAELAGLCGRISSS